MLTLQNPYERRNKLQYLSDAFEFNKWLKVEDIIEGVKLLLFLALREKEPNVKKSFLHAINNAVVYHQQEGIGNRVNWDTLIDSLSVLNKWQLAYALNILSFSGQERYLSMLEEYRWHADPEIRDGAVNAIRKIQSSLAYSADDQRKTGLQNTGNG